MDTSFELLSSMSPKITKFVKTPQRPPTKLALKKYFRRSSIVPKPGKLNESIISISSKSTSTDSSSNEPVVISDSDNSELSEKEQKSLVLNDTKRLSDEKYNNIKLWVDEVNEAKQNNSVFSTVSTVLGDDEFKRPDTNIAASSTFLGPESKRLDELFDRKTQAKSDLIINDSLISEDLSMENQFNNMTLNDSLELNLDVSLCTKLTKKTSAISTDESKECESLLDSVYGDSWRKKKDEILPSSGPCDKKKTSKIRAPNTEKPARTIRKNPHIEQKEENNLLKLVQQARFKKALESPWKASLQKICDSDSDSDDDRLVPTKLNFNEPVQGKIKPTTKKKTQTINSVSTYSFLASLSVTVPATKCDMTALIYRNKFKQHKEDLAQKLFNLYNEKIFDNSVPNETAIIWNDKMRRTAGFCRCKKIIRRTGATERCVQIELSTKVIDSADRLRDTLVHELCHAATWIVNQVSDGHGPFWKSWADKAMSVFPELPPIKRCHQYVINTKFTYRCEGCGYCIGRHTKSLDTERKRCGHCYGKFEVLINKVTKKGETKTMPATPKKATGFALFVKENYANHKSPALKHGDIMKILGQKFAELKCEQAQ